MQALLLLLATLNKRCCGLAVGGSMFNRGRVRPALGCSSCMERINKAVTQLRLKGFHGLDDERKRFFDFYRGKW